MKSYTEEIEFLCPQYHTRYCYDECNWFGNCPDQIRADELPESKAICSSCGRVCDEEAMFRIVTGGRRPKLICPQCRIKGLSETGVRCWAKKVKAERKEERDKFR